MTTRDEGKIIASDVASSSFAANLVPGDANNTPDAFLRDRQLETTERVSVDSSGGDADAASFEPLVSDDGAVVVFLSRATNLVPDDTNGRDDIFARHLGEPAVPANDDFGNAEPLAGRGDLVFGSNAAATKEAGEPAHAGNTGGASVWYRWTAPSTGPASFSACDSDFDTLLSVYTGAVQRYQIDA